MKKKWQDFCMQDKYKLPGNDCYLMRYDVARAKKDALLIPEMDSLISRLVDLLKADFPVRHKFVGKGVELSPAGNPMHDKNILVDIKDGGIPVAVAKAKKTDKMLVSHDVFGQLVESQKQECAAVDGAHQYATGETGRVSLTNPAGYWFTGDGEVGCTIRLQPGVKKTYTLVPKTFEISLTQIVVPSVLFNVGRKLNDLYGLSSGRYQVGTNGVTRLGDCIGAGDDEGAIRAKLEGFILRDKRGFHGSDHTMYGQCSRKVDGIFCYLWARNGEALLQYRNGEKWVGKCEYDIECAFEMVGDILYLLYVDVYKNNGVHLQKDLQDYFREQFEFILHLGKRGNTLEKTLTSTKICDNLPSDGIVIWGMIRQNFFKEKNTVDITKVMAETLIKEDHVVVDIIDSMEDGKIYEFSVEDTQHLKFIKVRDPLSKILPNMYKSVRRTLCDPNLSSVREHHANCPVEDNNCEICKYI